MYFWRVLHEAIKQNNFFFIFLFLLDNNIYLRQHTIQYIINKLLQIYLAYIGENKVIATISHLTYQSSLVHAWLLFSHSQTH